MPPGAFGLAVGGGAAYTGFDRWLCPAMSVVTAEEETEAFALEPGDSSVRRTDLRLGIGLGRRLGRETIAGAAFLHPQLRVRRTDERFGDFRSHDIRHEWWLEGGVSLRGDRIWGLAGLALQVGNYSPGEDVLDGSVRVALAVAF